jgi:hypothetical protein
MTSALTHDTLVVVAYHVWWPGVDPMYNYNTSEVTTRVNYYAVNGVPHVRVDGSYGMTPSVSNVPSLRNYIRGRYSAASPCTMEFTALATGETGVHVLGTITAEQDMVSPSQRLFVALITDTMQYQSPPGTNGETLFPDVFRDMWPTASGQAFTLTAGQTYDIDATLVRLAAWNLDDLEVVAWVQDYSSKAVHQAGIARISRNYGMVTQTASARQLIWDVNGGEVAYYVDLTNIGLMDDTYDVNLEGTFPAGWTYTVEAPGVPADPVHIQVPLASQQTTTLTVRVNPSGHPGSADFDVHVTTPSEPLLSARESFRLMSGLDILLVDDDEGSNRETWYQDALANVDMVCGRWDVTLNPLDASYLTGLDAIIWFTGDSWVSGSTLTAADRTLLANYLDQGGRLFLSGQGIGWDLRTSAFYSDYLHAIFRAPNVTEHHLLGVAGDPIGDGLDFNTAGGDGANNQIHQSSNDPDASGYATAILEWQTPPGLGGYPGLKVETPNYRLVYNSFGLEGIDNATARAAVMERTLNWLLGLTSAGDPGKAIPAEFSVGQNYPNPFNPETTIPYMLPERALVTVHVFNVLGREVATLSEGLQDAGAHSIRFNGADLSSGLYFYRLEAATGANTASATRKLMLLK